MLTDAIMQAIEDGRTLRAVVNGVAYTTEQIKAREHLKLANRTSKRGPNNGRSKRKGYRTEYFREYRKLHPDKFIKSKMKFKLNRILNPQPK